MGVSPKKTKKTKPNGEGDKQDLLRALVCLLARQAAHAFLDESRSQDKGGSNG